MPLSAVADTPTRTAPAVPAVPMRDPAGVRVLGPTHRVSLSTELRDIWARRDLLVQLASRDVRIRYKQAVMGFAWAVLTPLLIVGAGALVRVAMAAVSGRPLDRVDVGSVILKSFPWAFFSGAIGFAVNSITGSISLVTKIYFPRAILPVSVVLAHLFDLAVGVAALLVVLPFFGAQLSAALLWVPLLVALLVLFTTGLCVVIACANLFYRDVKYITQVVLTFGIFFTPVLFDATSFGPRLGRLLMFNPLSPIFEGLRISVLRGHNLLQPLTETLRGAPVLVWEPWYLLYTAVWGALLLAGGLLLFQRTQDLFAEFA